MMSIFTPLFRDPLLGEFAQLPPNAIINIGGTAGPTFTVDGKPLLFADGTATDGSGAVNLNLDLQGVYNNSLSPAIIQLEPGKDLIFGTSMGPVVFNALSGDVTFPSNIQIAGNVNGINLQDVVDHLDNSIISDKHPATTVSVDGSMLQNISGTNVQEIIQSIDTRLSGSGQVAVVGIEYVQSTPANIWIITHNKASERIQCTIWDPDNELLFADVRIINENTITITFNTPVLGRAVLMIF